MQASGTGSDRIHSFIRQIVKRFGAGITNQGDMISRMLGSFANGCQQGFPLGVAVDLEIRGPGRDFRWLVPVVVGTQEEQMRSLSGSDQEGAAFGRLARTPLQKVGIQFQRRRLVVEEVVHRFARSNDGGVEAGEGQGILPALIDDGEMLGKQVAWIVVLLVHNAASDMRAVTRGGEYSKWPVLDSPTGTVVLDSLSIAGVPPAHAQPA